MSQVKKFTIGNELCEVEINGEVFHIDITDMDLLDRVESIAKDIENINRKIDPTNYKDSVNELCNFCIEKIDSILGEGSTSRMYKNEKPNFVTLSKTLAIVIEAYSDFQGKEVQQLHSIKGIASKYEIK